nr:MAG TPA: distal tail protein [Caudoviricetes sp.]
MRSFTFNSKKSSDIGLIIEKATINKTPARPYDLQKIPGRAGMLIVNSSIAELENVEITYTVGCKDIAANRDAIAECLFGASSYAKLIDSSETDCYRLAICTSGQDWDEQILNFGTAKLVFSCKPFRFLTSGDTKTTLTAAGQITNPTAYSALPYIKIYGSGNITLSIGGQAFPFLNIGSYIECDSDLQMVYTGASGKSDRANFDTFPELVPGDNTVSWTGTVSKVEIIPHWRRL